MRAVAGRKRDDGIQIDFGNLRDVFGEGRQTQEEFAKRVDVTGWVAAVSLQEREALDLAQPETVSSDSWRSMQPPSDFDRISNPESRNISSIGELSAVVVATKR